MQYSLLHQVSAWGHNGWLAMLECPLDHESPLEILSPTHTTIDVLCNLTHFTDST